MDISPVLTANKPDTGTEFQAVKRSEERISSRNDWLSNRAEPKTKDSDFDRALKSVTGDRKPEENKKEQVSVRREFHEKMEALEKKLDRMVQEGGLAPDAAEDIKKLLETMKETVKAMDESGKQASLVKGGQVMDLFTYMTAVMEAIDKMMASGNQDNIKELAAMSMAQLDAVREKLAVPGPAIKTETGMKPIQNENPQNTTENAGISDKKETARVVVIDKRTAQSEGETAVSGKISISTRSAMEALRETIAVKPASDKIAVKKEDLQDIMSKPMQNMAENLKAPDGLKEAASRQYTQFSSPVSKANMEALMQSVSGRALVTLKDGKSELKMNLTPPELGRMNMSFKLEDGIMTGKIVVTTAEAKMLFDQNLGELQRMMQQAGVNVGRLDVSLGGGENRDAPDQQNKGSAYKGGAAIEDSMTASGGEPGGLYDGSINFVA